MAKARRTTHRSSTGTKLYAVRDSSGKFKDIQTYKRAHGADVRKSSGAERVAATEEGGEEGLSIRHHRQCLVDGEGVRLLNRREVLERRGELVRDRVGAVQDVGPNHLLMLTIGVGAIDGVLATMIGAWLYDGARWRTYGGP